MATSSGSPLILGLGVAAVVAVLGVAAIFWLRGGDEASPDATAVVVPEAGDAPAIDGPFGVEDEAVVDGVTPAADDAGTGVDVRAGAAGTTDPVEPTGEAPARVPGTVIEVPQSYPVTEADKYFVPREERRPGNLGGPPPLDFPGGPSDPDRADDGSADGGSDDPFGPPPAPGQ